MMLPLPISLPFQAHKNSHPRFKHCPSRPLQPWRPVNASSLCPSQTLPALSLLPHAALEGCERIEFVPFSAGDPAARAPCVAAAADGSRLLRLPVPLCFTTTPAKFERRSSSGSGGGGKDEPWIWGEGSGVEHSHNASLDIAS